MYICIYIYVYVKKICTNMHIHMYAYTYIYVICIPPEHRTIGRVKEKPEHQKHPHTEPRDKFYVNIYR